MPYNLLLLPLLGGYLFLHWWNPTRYHALRAEKERLLILASIPGLASLILAFSIEELLRWMIPCSPNLACFAGWWRAHVPFEYSGTSLLAFLLGATLWWPLNFIWDRDSEIDKVIDRDAVAFEVLLKEAQDYGKTIAVSMSSGKVYVGFVVHLFNPALPTRFIKILPTKSGYRDETTKQVRFTTFYVDALNRIDHDFEAKFKEQQTAKEKLDALPEDKQADHEGQRLKSEIDRLEGELQELAIEADDFGIVLPVPEIMSVNIFSEYVHDTYFLGQPKRSSEDNPQSD